MTHSKITIKQFLNNETEQTWQKIEELILSLDYTKDISKYEAILIQSILSDRSKLSGTALNFIKSAAIYNYKKQNESESKDMHDSANKIADTDNSKSNTCDEEVFHSFINYINPLFKLVGRSKKVFSLRSEETLVEVIKNITRPLIFLKENCSSLNKNVRLVSYKLLLEYYQRSLDSECLPFFDNGLKDPHYEVRMVCKVTKGNESFIKSIPRRAKEVFESIKSYSPFKKQVKINSEVKIRLNPEEEVNKKEITKDNVKQSAVKNENVKFDEAEIRISKNPIEQMKILSETPKKADLAVTLTPRKLQEYIDKYNTEYEIEKTKNDETVKIIKGLCSDIKEDEVIAKHDGSGAKEDENVLSADEEEQACNQDIEEQACKQDIKEQACKQDIKEQVVSNKSFGCLDAMNDLCSKENSLIVKDEIDDIFNVVENKKEDTKRESQSNNKVDSDSYTSIKLTEMENYLKTSNESGNKSGHKEECDKSLQNVTIDKLNENASLIIENSLLKNIEFCDESKIFEFSDVDKSVSKVIFDMPNIKEKRISANFSKLSINDSSAVTIEDSLKNMSVTENNEENKKDNDLINGSEFTTVQSDVFVRKKDVLDEEKAME